MSDTEDTIDLFQEPAEYYKPEPEATFASHTLLSGKQLKLRLVGHNPLWVSKSSGHSIIVHHSTTFEP
jgi:nicotinamide N-methyltransferase